jgi:hypothetical protein
VSLECVCFHGGAPKELAQDISRVRISCDFHLGGVFSEMEIDTCVSVTPYWKWREGNNVAFVGNSNMTDPVPLR